MNPVYRNNLSRGGSSGGRTTNRRR